MPGPSNMHELQQSTSHHAIASFDGHLCSGYKYGRIELLYD